MENIKNKESEQYEYQLYKDEQKLIKQGRKYSDGVTSTYIDPLKELDKEIRDSFYFKQGIKQTDFFKLSQADTSFDEKTQLDQINIEYEDFINETIIENMNQYGQPTYLCESKNFVIIGTDRSIIYIFKKRKGDDFFICGADKIKELGSVTSITVNNDEVIIAVGFVNGDIAIYELKNNYPRMTTIKNVFKEPVKIIQFISEIHPSLKEFCILAFDTTGQNQKVQVDIRIIFDTKFTSVSKEKLAYVIMNDLSNNDEEQNQNTNLPDKEGLVIRERSISSKYKEMFKHTDNSQGRQSLTLQSLPVHEICYFDSIQSERYFKGKYKILAVATEHSIYIGFILQKSIQFTFQFSKTVSDEPHFQSLRKQNGKSAKKYKPSIGWGKGYFHGNNHGFPILCIGWEDHIFLVKAQLLDDEQVHFYQAAYAKFQYNIQKCTFISNSIIFVIFTNKECALIHTSSFTLGPENPSISELNPCMYLDHKPDFQKIVQIAPKTKQPLLYSFGDCSVKFLISQNFMFTFRLKKWQEYFNNRNQIEWIKLMQQGLMVQTKIFQSPVFFNKLKYKKTICIYLTSQISKDIIKYLGGVEDEKKKRQEEMKSYFQTLGLTYIQFSLVTDEEISEEAVNKQLNKYVKEILILGIEFLLSTGNSEYLFSVVSQGIKNFGYENYFLECLQTFIEHSKLRYVPNQYLKIIMNFYALKGRYDILQKLILSLDLANLDISPILVMCMEYDLFNALIYTCTKKSGDFLTPLIKLFGRYQTGFDKKEQEKKFGLKILWYIQQSFSGILIDGSKIEEKTYPEMIRNMILFVFQSDNLQNLLQINRKITLDIIFILFKERIQQIIMQNCDIFRIEIIQQIIDRFQIFEKNKITPEYIPHQRILSIILRNKELEIEQIQKSQLSEKEKEENIQSLEFQNNVFLSRVLELSSYPFNIKKQIEIVHFLIENPKIFNYFEQKTLGQEIDIQMQSDQIKQDSVLESGIFLSNQQKYNKKWLLRNAFLISILKPLVLQIKNPQTISSIIQSAEISEFSEACCFLYNYLKKYKKCFELYNESRNPLIQKRIFQWIEQVLENPSTEINHILELKELIINKIKDLVKLDQVEAMILIKKYFHDKQKAIILQLDQYPDDQLCILEGFLRDCEHVSDDLKVTHIKLLCMRKPHLVVQNLKEREYPIDQSLNFCKQFRVLDGQVYLNQRNGNFTEALNIQIQIIVNGWQECLRKYTFEKIDYLDTDSLNQITQHLKKGMKICIEAQKEDDSYDSLWFTMFDKIVIQEIDISTLTSSSVSPLLQTISTSIVSDLLEAISVNTNLNDVIERIHQDYGTIPLKAFLQTKQNFKLKLEFLASNHSTAKEIIQDHMSSLQEKYMQLKMLGLSGQQLPGFMVCQLCENQILTNQMEKETRDTLVFYCGHTYHTKCVEDFIQPTTCPICIENPKIYITNISSSKNFTKNNSNLIQAQNEKEKLAENSLDIINQLGKYNGWIQNSENTTEQPDQTKIKLPKSKMIEKLQRFDKKQKEKLKESHRYLHSLQSKQ